MASRADTLADFVAALFDPTATDDADRAAVLLADHLWCVEDGGRPATAALSAADAAAERAWAHCRLDRDDIVWDALVHPGSVVWPVVLAVGEQVDAGGPDLVRAAGIGYETAVRVAALTPPGQRPLFHSTATAGTVAAAAASAALLDLGPEAVADALGHALSVMGGSAGALRELSGTRWFHRAHAARSGVHAALAAARGLGATRGDLDLGGGLVPPLGRDAAAALCRPGRAALADASLRMFPTSGWNQVAFECAAEVGRALAATATGPVSLRVEVDAATLAGSRSDPWFDLEAAVRAGLRWDAASLSPGGVEVREWPGPGARIRAEAPRATAEASVRAPLDHPTRRASTAQLGRRWGRGATPAQNLLDALATVLADPAPGAARAILAV